MSFAFEVRRFSGLFIGVFAFREWLSKFCEIKFEFANCDVLILGFAHLCFLIWDFAKLGLANFGFCLFWGSWFFFLFANFVCSLKFADMTDC